MEELEQLTIFDTPLDTISITQDVEETVLEEELTIETLYIEDIVPYEIGDSVRVDPDNLDENDVLNYNYLLDYLKKKGIVTKVILKPTLQYEVAYGDTIACMYHKDLTI